MRILASIAFAFACATAVTCPVAAQEQRDASLQRALSDREIAQRLAYLDERLDTWSSYSAGWWYGWTAFYSLGVVVEATEAGLADKNGERANSIVSAVKAMGGVFNLLREPLRAAAGAAAIRAMPAATREDRLRQLQRGEELLRVNAAQARRRWSWQRHLGNVAVNSAGALIVWQGFEAPVRAWRSAGIGIAVGELMILTQPWWPRSDWEEYVRRFDSAPTAQRPTWRILPTGDGVALQMSF